MLCFTEGLFRITYERPNKKNTFTDFHSHQQVSTNTEKEQGFSAVLSSSNTPLDDLSPSVNTVQDDGAVPLVSSSPSVMQNEKLQANKTDNADDPNETCTAVDTDQDENVVSEVLAYVVSKVRVLRQNKRLQLLSRINFHLSVNLSVFPPFFCHSFMYLPTIQRLPVKCIVLKFVEVSEF